MCSTAGTVAVRRHLRRCRPRTHLRQEGRVAENLIGRRSRPVVFEDLDGEDREEVGEAVVDV